MSLYINDVCYGKCGKYRQGNESWIFSLENGRSIELKFSMIKWFASCGKLDIITT